MSNRRPCPPPTALRTQAHVAALQWGLVAAFVVDSAGTLVVTVAGLPIPSAAQVSMVTRTLVSALVTALCLAAVAETDVYRRLVGLSPT